MINIDAWKNIVKSFSDEDLTIIYIIETLVIDLLMIA